MLKTTNYEQFKLIDKNREKGINPAHVNLLVDSIRSRNLLHMRPILVNERMEVIDGQHRLAAAQRLGVEIYYNVEKDIQDEDIILMNIAKTWTAGDFLNFWVKKGNENYIKLSNFMQKNEINLKIALMIFVGQSKSFVDDWKRGKFVYEENELDQDLSICWDTINCIKKLNGYSGYTTSAKFWKAMIKIFRHPDFDIARWFSNLSKLSSRFCPKSSEKDYLDLFKYVHNYRNNKKIKFSNEDIDE